VSSAVFRTSGSVDNFVYIKENLIIPHVLVIFQNYGDYQSNVSFIALHVLRLYRQQGTRKVKVYDDVRLIADAIIEKDGVSRLLRFLGSLTVHLIVLP